MRTGLQHNVDRVRPQLKAQRNSATRITDPIRFKELVIFSGAILSQAGDQFKWGGKIFYEFTLPDDPFLDRFSSGYETTDNYFRSRRWFKADKGRSSPPTYAFRTAEGGPVVGYCAVAFGKQPYPDNASSTDARYLVIYMIGINKAFQRTQNPLAPGRTYAASVMAALEDMARAKQSCVGLSLWVRSTNEAAIGLYRKVGFTEDPGGPSPRNDGDPILTMRKILI